MSGRAAPQPDWADELVPSLFDVVHVEVSGPGTLFVRFEDGLEGRVRFQPSKFRNAFAPLADVALFARAHVADGTVAWPGEIDLAPDAMHDAIAANGEWVLGD